MNRAPDMLAIVGDSFGGRGGIAQYNRDFFNAAVKTGGVASIAIAPRNAPDTYELPQKIHQTAAQRGRVAYAVGALQLCFSHRFDLVFCGHLFMAPLAAFIARIKGAKLIIQTHGIEAWPRPTSLRRSSVECADVVLCVSRYTRASVLSWAAVPPERVMVLPNTVREVFSPGDGSKMRKTLGLERKLILLTVARMDSGQKHKGQDRVISAIPYLVSEGLDVCYLIVGEGQDRSRLEAHALDLGVSNRVRFLGLVETESLVEIYRMADLFVMASSGEGFGIAFLEAMASGTPALGLDIGGAKDALAEGNLGKVVSQDKLPFAMASSLRMPKPEPMALAAAVRARFGRESFETGVHNVLDRLSEAPLRAHSRK